MSEKMVDTTKVGLPTMKMRMTAKFWAESTARLLAGQSLSFSEREGIIEDMRALAQAAADAGLVYEIISTKELKPDQQ